MANITLTTNPSEVTATDTIENTLIFPSNTERIVNSNFYEVSIKVTVGSFKVNTKGLASGGITVDSTDGLFILTLSNNDKLSFQATTIGDSFRIYL